MSEVSRKLYVKVFFYGDYDDTDIFYGDFEDLNEENEMEKMMEFVREEMERTYGDTEAWDEGKVSWTLDTWEDL